MQEQRHQEVSRSVGPSPLSEGGLKISGFSEARTLYIYIYKSSLDTILSQKNSVRDFFTSD